MAPKDTQTALAEKSVLFNLFSTEFAAQGKKRIEEFVNMQEELFEKLQESNKHWLDCAQSEAKLASEFASKVTAARSIPDTMAVCQELGSRQFEMLAEAGKQLLADTQNLMEASARMLSRGWWTNGRDDLNS